LSLPEIAARLAVEARDIGSAFGALSKSGLAAMNEAKKAVLAAGADLGKSGLATLRALFALFDDREAVAEEELSPAQAELIAFYSRKRGADKGAFRTVEREEVDYRLTGLGRRPPPSSSFRGSRARRSG
jgi:phenylalanyl-tRNA synthetase alpha chain